MERLKQDEIKKHHDQIQLFIKLVFENSDNDQLLLDICKRVGVNTLFPCQLLCHSTVENEIIQLEIDETSFLLIALNYQNEDVIRLLLENGADPNGITSDGEPPLWELQYEYDNPEYGLRITKLLLDYGADPNIKWETEGFYTYVDTKDVDLIQSKEELDYLMNLTELLEKYGGKYDWE